MKAKKAVQAKKLEEIPNIGPRIAGDLRLLGINEPAGLKGKDPKKLYCVISSLGATRFHPSGATSERQRRYYAFALVFSTSFFT